jgi:putative phosphotransacetylase
MGYKVEIGISNKHLHLSREHLDLLFGKGYELKQVRCLKQPGQYASEEKVDVEGPKGIIKGMRVLGPPRKETQVELALTDARSIGINTPIRESGNLERTPGCRLIGPKGEVELEYGVIAAFRHVHLSVSEAAEAEVKDGDIVSVRVVGNGERTTIFEQVLIRSGKTHSREMHLDTDEANAACCRSDEWAEIILEKQS